MWRCLSLQNTQKPLPPVWYAGHHGNSLVNQADGEPVDADLLIGSRFSAFVSGQKLTERA